jgi:two-component system, chemotaxis family, sensor kinase CheA
VSDQRARLLEIFREEAGERLDRVVATLLAIDAGEPAADATDSLFRDVHSLKGGAGLVGLDQVRDVAHAAEELLSGVREAGQTVPKDLVAPLLAVVDAIRRGVAGEEIVPEQAIAELPAAAGAPAASTDAAPVDPPVVEPVLTNGAPAQPRARIDGSIRVSAAKVDRVLDTAGTATLHQRTLAHLIDPLADERVGEALDRGEVLLDELQDAAIELRALPLSAITGSLPRYVRDLAVAEGKEAALAIHGVETQLDRTILDGLSDMLGHLLRNAIAHGIETPQERTAAGKPSRGRVELRAEQRGGRVAIEVSDDGRGVAAELLSEAPGDEALADRLARPGFSTAGKVDSVAGRGVGLDAVKAHVESIGGGLAVQTEPGKGTTITLDLPLTLAVLHVLLVERRGQAFGVPVARVEEVVAVEETTSLGGRPSIVLRGESITLGDMAVALGGAGGELAERAPALILCHGGATVALACDRLLGEQSVIVKGLGPLLGRRRQYLGGAILSDGRVALIVDPAMAVAGASAGKSVAGANGARPAPVEADASPKVLVVDDQFTVRELQRSILEAAGYRVETARDGREALAQAVGESDVELVVTDIDMPEMTGFELLESIRGDAQRSSLPVVVVTGRGGEDDRKRGVESGADAYIVKEEFDQRALLDTVERLIGR